MLIGSPLGVITAATTTMITIAWRRQLASWLRRDDADDLQRDEQRPGTRSRAPNASIMNTMSFT